MRKTVQRSTAPPLSFKPLLAAAVLSVRRIVVSSLHTLCPKLPAIEAVSARVSTVRCVFFIFLKGRRFFENNFFLGGTITLSCKLWFVGWLVAVCKSVFFCSVGIAVLFLLFFNFASQMRNILAKELKIKFIEALNGVDGFSYEDGNPFIVKIGSDRYFVFLKNISPAYFKNSPDVTRIQLPSSEHFKKVFRSTLPFIILGYDVDNDTVVSWNPKKVKERLNVKGNVSLYSRNSLQESIKEGEFKSGFLSNGEKIILFNRESLPDFFESWNKLFRKNELAFGEDDVEVTSPDEEEDFATDKLYEIRDRSLIAELRPLLKKNRVLEAVEICSKRYGNKYKNMNFKDWFKLVNELYQEVTV
jgi:hypothetical protein